MTYGFLIALVLLFGTITVLTSKRRSSVVALCVCGFSVAGVFLERGAELLAILQLFSSVIITFVLLFYSENPNFAEGFKETKRKDYIFKLLPTTFVCGAFVVLIVHHHLLPAPVSSANKVSWNLSVFGKTLIVDYPLALIFVALFLVVILIGAGFVSREEE